MTVLISHTGRPIQYPEPHDPDSTVWYVMIWDQALAYQSATITGGSFSVLPAPSTPPTTGQMVIAASVIGSPATIDGVSYAQTCAAKITGGTVGVKYTVTCAVETSIGETIQKSFILRCGQQ